jgi:acid phosphatase
MLLHFVLLALIPHPIFAASSYKFDPLKHLSGIAPYFEPEDLELDPNPPQGCKVTRVSAGRSDVSLGTTD